MRRISVVGISGSGKTTLAGRLAQRLGVTHIEVDALFHQAGWVPRPAEELRAVLSERLAAPGWVCDGNYDSVRPVVWSQADTVVWLDPPRRTVLRRVVLRTLRRIVTRRELWNGNRETVRNAFFDRESIIRWTWVGHGRLRARYAAAMTDPQWSELRFVRLGSPAQVRRFLASVR